MASSLRLLFFPSLVLASLSLPPAWLAFPSPSVWFASAASLVDCCVLSGVYLLASLFWCPGSVSCLSLFFCLTFTRVGMVQYPVWAPILCNITHTTCACLGMPFIASNASGRLHFSKV